MALFTMLVIMIVVLLWAFGVPITLIVIAFNLSDIRRAIEAGAIKPYEEKKRDERTNDI